MRARAVVILAACATVVGPAAFAHRIDEYLQATIFSLKGSRIVASMRLIPGIQVAPAIIASIDGNGDGAFSEAEARAYAERVLSELTITVDGKTATPELHSWTFPEPAQMREGLGEIEIQYAVGVPAGGEDRSLVIENHHESARSVYLMNVLVPSEPSIHIVAQKRNQQQSLYELDYEEAGGTPLTAWGKARLWLNGVQVASLFWLGMHHIAEGTDHLLFLLVLLLPAPLLAAGNRWGAPVSARQSLLRILGIVTAFTIGHSITLSLAALGVVTVPSRPVEVLIAVSIFISAVHAFRPIFPGKEAFIAAFFGLIHGLAFAATLDRLGLGWRERMAGILSFNLGIEAMQMLVVAAILPSFMLMSRTRAYPAFRVSGAVFAGAAAAGWVLERLFGISADVDLIVNAFARHSLLIALTLFLVSAASRLVLNPESQEVRGGAIAGLAPAAAEKGARSRRVIRVYCEARMPCDWH